MTKLLCILAFILVCISINAQTKIDITPNPCSGCWGITEIPVLSDSDRVALRLYRPGKQKWYDFSTYKFRGEGKRAVWIVFAVAGILHGGREAYHAEPTVLQNVFGGPDDSWIGPMQWKRQYYKRDQELPHKPNIWNSARDYYHFSGFTAKTVWIGGAFTIGVSKQPLKYKLLDLLIGTLITSGTASLTYNILR